MAPNFVFPSDLKSLATGADDAAVLRAEFPVDVTSIRPADLEELVKGLVFDLSDREVVCVEDQDVFDRVYSLACGFPRHLPPSAKFNLVETLRSNLSVLLPSIDSISRSATPSPLSSSPQPSFGSTITDVSSRISSHRNALKIYTFFLFTIALAEESLVGDSAGGRGSKVGTQSRKKSQTYAWDWESQRSRIVNLIANSLEINLSLLFGSNEIDENYLSFISKCVFTLYENQAVLKDADTREGLGRIVGNISTKHQRTAQSCASILHLIHKFEYTVVHIAELVAAAEKKYGDGSLAVSLIREIGRTDPKDYVRDTVGAENIGRFLIELSDRSPKLMSTNIGILIPHFGGESYKIRNALVGVLGKLVSKAFKDVDGDISSKSLRLRTKQAMLDILIERCRDVSAYTRSRVLQVWADLCEEHAVSIGLWNEVAEVASGRLEDKSAIVRKSALNLLITMLQHNPFGPQLRLSAFEATLQKFKEKLGGMESSDPKDVTDGSDPSDGGALEQGESISDSCLPSTEKQQENDTAIPEIGNLEQTRALVASLEAGLRFSKCITSLMPTLVQLLASSSVTDVENTILLLMRCKQFQIDGSEECLHKMLPLVFSQDKSIHEAVENAFITIYIRKNPMETARNLLNLSIDSSIGDFAALEFLVCSLMSRGEISMSTDLEERKLCSVSGLHSLLKVQDCQALCLHVIESLKKEKGGKAAMTKEKAGVAGVAANAFWRKKGCVDWWATLDTGGRKKILQTFFAKAATPLISALWDYFSFNVSGVVAAQSRGALSVLCMAARSSPKILGSHLQDIIDIGFGRWAKEEALLAKTACVALDRLSEEDKEKLRSTGGRVFGILQNLLTGFSLPDKIWYAAADQAIRTIYSTHPMPEAFAADIVKRSLTSVFSCTGKDEVLDDVFNGSINFMSIVPAAKLGRFLFIVSHIALNHLIYIETCIRKIQKQKIKKEKSKLESQDVSTSPAKEPETNSINAELGLNASEDALIDSLSERAEKEIVSSALVEKNLIGYCAPFISKLCRNLNLMEKFPELQASAMLALCRLMIVDSEFCEANLQLLFTVVDNASSETVRSNCTVALGDLAVRFPNLLEPWTENMYARLRDPSVSVRKNAVLVLSHLILNDMMKVKGYINEMAMCIEDGDARISSLAKLFFNELSKKGSNPIYNLFPDILSRLCNQSIKEESFCNIMQLLINSIKKDKQMEALAEKLCNRFSGVSDVKEWEHIAYCLSQLTFSDKGIKKLIESFKAYKHVLSEDPVMNHFKNIIAKCKKFAKPEAKACIEEFEEKLSTIYNERKEQEVIARNAHNHRERAGNFEDGTVEDPITDYNKVSSASAAKNYIKSEESCTSSTVTECDEDSMEIQSPDTSHRGVNKLSKMKTKTLAMNSQMDSRTTRHLKCSRKREGTTFG